MEVTDSIGGSAQATVKKEYGARLRTPAAESVDTHAIGRGAIDAVSRGYMPLAGGSSGLRTVSIAPVCPRRGGRCGTVVTAPLACGGQGAGVPEGAGGRSAATANRNPPRDDV